MRREADEIAVAYSFDLRTRQLETRMIPNPGAGNVHVFTAYRVPDDPNEPVTMRDERKVLAELGGLVPRAVGLPS